MPALNSETFFRNGSQHSKVMPGSMRERFVDLEIEDDLNGKTEIGESRLRFP